MTRREPADALTFDAISAEAFADTLKELGLLPKNATGAWVVAAGSPTSGKRRAKKPKRDPTPTDP